MFSLSEMKLLNIQLTADIQQAQRQVHQSDFADPNHSRLENKLITLTSIKRKVSTRLSEPPYTDITITPRVLVVDDSETVRDVVRCYFIELGFEQVDVANDGEQAWRKLQAGLEQSKPYGLLVSDWNMPKLDGLSLIKNVRQHQALHNLPSYLITGIQEKQQILEAIKHGINGYLVKPINYNHIKKKFSKYLVNDK